MLRKIKPFQSSERAQHVYCDNCAGMVPLIEVKIANREQDVDATIITGTHSICGQRVYSFLMLK